MNPNLSALIPVFALLVLFLAALVFVQILWRKLQQARRQYEAEALRVRNDSQRLIDQQIAVLKQEAERIRDHYEAEARRVRDELEPLRQYQGVVDIATQGQALLSRAMEEADGLRMAAHNALVGARLSSEQERSEAAAKARELNAKASAALASATAKAEATLTQATRESGRIVAEANKSAEKIAGDAYVALRDKQLLDQAVKAIENVIEGYGDRYIKPTRSVLDDLAAHFGHTEAGEALRLAREQSRRMVEAGEAAACSYVEDYRRETAIRFVIDAFNGRVDGILTRTKHDNYGTLEQELRDTYSLVNLNGRAFRDAHILPAYLDARLSELKWAVAVQELRLQEREEQRRIQEQIREEEKARREYERAMQEAERDEAALKKALEQAHREVEQATAAERAKLDQQIAQLTQKLTEAEARNQRAKSMAEQTRAGHVYVISNVGAFGEEVFKIGMTRRLEPEDRIWELSSASVPFEYDIHAMIYSENAPELERLLHECFEDLRMNKVNYRKEFFRLPLVRIREFVETKGLTGFVHNGGGRPGVS